MSTRDRVGRLALQVRIRTYRVVRRVFGRLAWKVLWPGTEPVPVYFAPGHFHSPLPAAVDIARAAPSEAATWSEHGIAAIDLRFAAQQALMAELDLQTPSGPRWSPNSFFPEGDAAVHQALLRHFRPRTVVEIGSGWSTAALFDVHVPDSLTLVEPYPDRVREVLRPDDWSRCTLVEAGLQDVDPALFAALGAGDLLFVDSTHVAKLASDVNRLFFDVLPALAPGVIVHIHDIRYPFEYPGEWIRAGWAWNEAYLLRAFLQYNDAFEILLWPDMLRHAGAVTGGYGGIWLRKVR